MSDSSDYHGYPKEKGTNDLSKSAVTRALNAFLFQVSRAPLKTFSHGQVWRALLTVGASWSARDLGSSCNPVQLLQRRMIMTQYYRSLLGDFQGTPMSNRLDLSSSGAHASLQGPSFTSSLGTTREPYLCQFARYLAV